MLNSAETKSTTCALQVLVNTLLFVLAPLLLFCCPCRYSPNYANVTNYKPENVIVTPGGIKVSGATLLSKLLEIDASVNELEKCLLEKKAIKKPLCREGFGVLIPPDWYVSPCSGQQLVPSRAYYKLCEAKGIVIPEKCRDVVRPTTECPCPCNFRAIVQDNYWIVAAPDLKLMKAELARLVTGVNNVWTSNFVECVK